MKKKPLISVIGASNSCTADDYKLAEEVGRELARRGAILICGGLDGVMEAACRGAAAEGGLTVGILPGNKRDDANPYVNIPIVTGLGYARNSIVAKSGQAVIAIGGSYGTLSEIAYALQGNIPVIGLGTWSLATSEGPDKSIIMAKDAADAVKKALDRARKGGGDGSH
jgi:uncharacterized protein (TIGR00725 family)